MQQSSMSAILLDVPLEGSNLCFACLYEHSQYFLLHYVCHMALCLSILWLTTLRKEESILLEIIEEFRVVFIIDFFSICNNHMLP